VKIYTGSEEILTPLLGVVGNNDLPFHLEKDRWEFVSSVQEADIVPLVMPSPIKYLHWDRTVSIQEQVDFIGPSLKDKMLLIMIHTHISDTTNVPTLDMFARKYAEYTDNVFTVSNNSSLNHPKHLFTDFSFNLVKAYFTEYTKFDLVTNRLWSQKCTVASYTLPLIKSFNVTKRFLVPNVIRTTNEYKEYARKKLAEKIEEDDCFYSDFSKNVVLLPEEKSQHCLTAHGPNGAGFLPISNHYYTESIVSAYVETIAKHDVDIRNPVTCISEKTFIPLLKGHFILPFGHPGIIRELKEVYGFRFPEWIDYSYDSIYNEDKRLKMFLASMSDLRKISLRALTDLANKDIEIRKHNRRIFYSSEYDSLYDKVKVATGF
jgi:hypothetical protein